MVGPDKTQVGTNAGSTEKKERKKKGCLTHMHMLYMHMHTCHVHVNEHEHVHAHVHVDPKLRNVGPARVGGKIRVRSAVLPNTQQTGDKRTRAQRILQWNSEIYAGFQH